MTGEKKTSRGKATARTAEPPIRVGRLVLTIASWVGVMCSALSVVYVTYACRVSTQKLEVLRKEASHLNVESGKLLLEKSSLTAYSRIETVAKNELGMFVPDNNSIVVVDQ